MPVMPASAETSYMDFVNYSYSWLGDDPDSLWQMTRDDVRGRLQKQNAFSCKALYDSSAGRSYYLCRSSEKFSGKYRMRFYFSDPVCSRQSNSVRRMTISRNWLSAMTGRSQRFRPCGRTFRTDSAIPEDSMSWTTTYLLTARDRLPLISVSEPVLMRYLVRTFCSIPSTDMPFCLCFAQTAMQYPIPHQENNCSIPVLYIFLK